MSFAEKLALRALHCLDPERAHDLALMALSAGLAGGNGSVSSPRLGIDCLGCRFPNPIGTAAGFDKNGVAIAQTLRTGFGFAEVGAVTPKPQPGNPQPRLFRLHEDRAVINRFGFNNNGLEALYSRLAETSPSGIRGVNLGANKDSDDRPGDFATGLERLYDHANFFTVNVSSPNTEKLRDLQGRDALQSLLTRVIEARNRAAGSGGAGQVLKPVLVKIAPDLTEGELADVAGVALDVGLDGIVATNTTLGREGLRSPHAREAGGLSGRPIALHALAVLRRLRHETGGRIPLIGVGGIESGQDAYDRIRAGASLVQLYSALVYEGIGLGARIARDLDDLLARDGVASVAEVVGTA
ncbi:MAG: quinone-dependent dihydroorotate dehydrogenase [Pseudomonadota bacterium]